MRKADSTNRPSAGENYWRKRPSEIQGYNRTLYTTTKDNEYIRVDFNLRERRVRLYIEDNDEGGNPYFSVITNGKITVERNATTGRITELKEKFNKRGFIFSTIPNKDVIGLINNNYGIGIKGKNRAVPKAEEKIKEREQVKKSTLPQVLQSKLRETQRPGEKQRNPVSLTLLILLSA